MSRRPHTPDRIPPQNLPGRIVRLVRRNVPLVVLDLGVITAAYLGPLVMRFEGAIPDRYWGNFWPYLPVLVFIHLVTNYLFGLYGQMWRYAGVQEARRVILAGATGGLLVIGAGALFGGDVRPLPISVVTLGATISFLGFGAIRFQTRLFSFRRRAGATSPTRILMVGAGDAGASLLKDMLANPAMGLEPVALVDDDRKKLNLSLHGVPVMGARADIPDLVASLGVDQVLVTVPSAPSSFVREVASLCEKIRVPVRVLPGVKEIVGRRVSVKDIRDLQIEDLLGRRQVSTDLQLVRSMIAGKKILVTGAGGSIGSEIARQVADFSPKELVLLDHDETHLHDIVTDLGGASFVVSALADIRDQKRVHEVIGRARPEVIFHAAAHKHVPILETHPEEALATNIIGTANLADAALAAHVGRFVLISTDKAVKPSSVMGASKRFAEEIVRSLLGNGCVLCAVRFGNVLGSRGSVVPTFLKQIAKGGPVTVTDPGMARYFMSLQEAVQLVLQAAAVSEGGEVFTLDMGEPMNIMELAEKLIRLSGREPHEEIAITTVGPRPGEKLVEELVDSDEEPRPSGHPGVFVSQPAKVERALLRRALNELEELASTGNRQELADRLKALAQSGLQQAGV